MQSEPLFYTLDQVAELMQVSKRTVERAVARGELKVVHLGRVARVPASVIHRMASAPKEPRP